MKAIYEVRVEVDMDAASDYLLWLREHMKQIVETCGFERADMFTLEQDSSTAKVWVVQYVAPSRKIIDDYLNIHSQAFRADGVSRFSGKFQIERRILNFQESFTA